MGSDIACPCPPPGTRNPVWRVYLFESVTGAFLSFSAMNRPPDKYGVQFHFPCFLQDQMIFPSHAELAQKHFPFQHVQMSHRPFEFDPPIPQDNQHSQAHPLIPTTHRPPPPPPSSSVSYPSQHLVYPNIPQSLPFYSTTGFDMISILSKVATRRNPRIMLGPVDMSCSFLVSDIRTGDAPIVYASPTFCCLTGYSEAEILGRNCRFLQSPSGSLQRGDPRLHTAPEAVRLMYRSIVQAKECQTSLINYRKDGTAFVNLVTLIPICANDDEPGIVTHFVGFQVDLVQQPGAIMQKLRDGTYIVNYSMMSTGVGGVGAVGGIGGRKGRGVSGQLVDALRRAAAVAAPVTSQVAMALDNSAPSSPSTMRDPDYTDIQSLILENSDDFIHVLSLKGSLLYVAPSIFRILGYTSSELIGRSMSDLCHPADIVPVMRELKDASSPSPGPNPTPAPSRPSVTPVTSSMPISHDALYPPSAYIMPPHHPQFYPASLHSHPSQIFNTPLHPPFALSQPTQPAARPLTSLLFRARHKAGHYVWLLCRGRLHVEPGKGRKAVVMVGRPVRSAVIDSLMERRLFQEGGDDCGRGRNATRPSNDWGIVAPNGIILSGGEGLPAGRPSSSPKDRSSPSIEGNQAVGKTIASFVPSVEEARCVGAALAAAACAEEACVKKARCTLQSGQDVEMRFYAAGRQIRSDNEVNANARLPAGVVFEAVSLKEEDESLDSPRAQMSFQQSSQERISPSFMPRDSLNLGGPAYISAQTRGAAANINYTTSFPYPSTSNSSPSCLPTFPMDIHSLPHLTIPSQVQSSPPSPTGQAGTPIPMSISPQDPSLKAQIPLALSKSYSATPTSGTPNDCSLSSGPASQHEYHHQSVPQLPLSLSPLAETSWQYELTKLKFENERLKVEAAKLERRGRRRGNLGTAHLPASDSSLSLSSSSSLNSQMTGVSIPMTIGAGMKRCREE